MDYSKHGLSILSDVELAEARFRRFLPPLEDIILTSTLALDLALDFISPFLFEETVKPETLQSLSSFNGASNKNKFVQISSAFQKL